ncbi:MAG: hypothetical protein P8N63_01060, partial [Pseudomonadales bacterium]|nr:hypothetical protein [Pseudomonadales bacterium]
GGGRLYCSVLKRIKRDTNLLGCIRPDKECMIRNSTTPERPYSPLIWILIVEYFFERQFK